MHNLIATYEQEVRLPLQLADSPLTAQCRARTTGRTVFFFPKRRKQYTGKRNGTQMRRDL